MPARDMNPTLHFTVPNPPIAFESFGDEAVIVHLERGTYYSVRGPAFAAWTLVSAGVAVGAIVDGLAATYDAPASEIEAAVTALIAELEREGLIVPGAGAAPSPPVASAPVAPPARQPFERPVLEKFTDVQELLALDPIHDVDGTGWPQPKAEHATASDAPAAAEADPGEDEDPG
jgi:coenzyme PQQ synthesis protein D (PqqD)